MLNYISSISSRARLEFEQLLQKHTRSYCALCVLESILYKIFVFWYRVCFEHMNDISICVDSEDPTHTHHHPATTSPTPL